VFLSRGGFVVRFDQIRHERAKAEEIRIGIAGANGGVAPRGIGRLQGTVNYYIGNDPAQWKTGLHKFSRVSYPNIYPGTNLVFYGNRRQLEFDFEVAPGRDVSAIALNIDGAVIKPGKDDLELTTPSGKTLTLKKPVLFQGVGLARRNVAGSYLVRKPKQVGFSVGGYDRRQALVIDPALVYSTMVGMIDDKGPFAMAVDGSGAVYITGESVGPAGVTNPPVSAFVVKLDPSGSTLLYETHLAGTQRRETSNPDTPAAGFAMAVDANGNSYVAGLTDQTDFPTTAGAFSTTAFCTGTSGNVGCMEPFAAKLDSNGKLVYSTFLVQSSVDSAGPVASSIAVDSTGALYVTGTTAKQIGGPGALSVAGLPTTSAAFQTTRKNDSSVFVLKLHPDGSKLDYSTYLGGSTSETPGGIAVDANGVAYVDGGTSSSDFPVTAGASLTTNPGTAAFYSKVKADGSGLVYSTFLATNSQTEGTSIAIDSGLAAYLAGRSGACASSCCTLSSLPQFATKFDASGNLVYSSAVGTQRCDSIAVGAPPPSSIAVDKTGAAYVASASGSPSGSAMTVSKLDSSGVVVFTAPVGPINSDGLFGGAALDSQQNFYVAGFAGTLFDPVIPPDGVKIPTPDVGTTVGAFQTLPIANPPAGNQGIMFVQKWTQTLGAAVPVPNPREVDFSPILKQGVTSSARTIQLFNYGDATLAFNGTSLGGANVSDFAISGNNNTCAATVAIGSSCSFQVTFTPTVGVGTRNATVTLSFGGGLASQTVSLVGQAGTPAFTPSSSPVDFGTVEVGSKPADLNLVVQLLTITNTGTGPMNLLSSPVFQGSNASDFRICAVMTGSCGGLFNPPTQIAPGGKFTWPLLFTPSGNGLRTAQIVFNTDAPGSPQSVQLQGNGIPMGNGGFNVVGNGSTTATVAAGQTATYNLAVVSNQSSFPNVSVSCSGAPSGASCTANPGSLTLQSQPQNVTVTVTTTPRTSASLQVFPKFAWAAVAIVGMVGLRRKRICARLVMLSALAVLAFAVSCGGGGSSGGGGAHNSGTPAGTYTLTVTVTATGNAGSNSLPLTLNVQ
jgi:hypothetical protein